MALNRSCDRPGCETVLEVDMSEVDDLPAGWWVLERADAIGAGAVRYAVCSLECVRDVAEMFAEDPAPGPDDGDHVVD